MTVGELRTHKQKSITTSDKAKVAGFRNASDKDLSAIGWLRVYRFDDTSGGAGSR